MNSVFHALQILHVLFMNDYKIEHCYDCAYFMEFKFI
jgi:hypothetical protein